MKVPIVSVVDDDEDVRKSISRLITSIGIHVRTYETAEAFLSSYDPEIPGCLVLDVRMPGMSGLELQKVLIRRQFEIPIIFVSGCGDIPMAVQAIKLGALDFIEKPFNHQYLLDCVQKALSFDRENRRKREEQRRIFERYETLTQREREVMHQVVEGKANKVIAMEMKLSQKTVEFHRANVMRKMNADSLAELVKACSMLSSNRENPYITRENPSHSPSYMRRFPIQD